MENTVTVSWKTLGNMYGIAAAYRAASEGMPIQMTSMMLSLANVGPDVQEKTLNEVKGILNAACPADKVAP